MDHAYVDESTNKNYLMAVVVVKTRDRAALRSLVRAAVHPPRTHFHAKSEEPKDKLRLLSDLAEANLEAWIFDARRAHGHRRQRNAILDRIVLELAASGKDTEVILDVMNDHERRIDSQQLHAARQRHDCVRQLTYRHATDKKDDHLLALPDLLAWSWANGGDMRRKAQVIIQHSVVVAVL